MKIFFHPNTAKHGLTKEQILSAYSSGWQYARIRERDFLAEPPRYALIGFDKELREIELVFVELSDGILIIHANYLTTGFRKEWSKTK